MTFNNQPEIGPQDHFACTSPQFPYAGKSLNSDLQRLLKTSFALLRNSETLFALLLNRLENRVIRSSFKN